MVVVIIVVIKIQIDLMMIAHAIVYHMKILAGAIQIILIDHIT